MTYAIFAKYYQKWQMDKQCFFQLNKINNNRNDKLNKNK